ncbi:MAG TPA: C1 family peptidase [Bacteroidales bacterium]|nr:C1 family peptidase [Bacteroidales bacterium]
MKTLILILTLQSLLITCISGQDVDTNALHGSWLGRVTTEKFSLRVILRFEKKRDNLLTYLDSPDQGMKDLKMDRVWVSGDSLFVDATSLNAGIIYKGKILPGDSVIAGVWGGSIPLTLRPTDFVYTLKTNYDPYVRGYKVISLVKTSPIKNQQGTSFCWSFATTSFIETEALRLGKKPVVLSPMFYVVPTTVDKAERYIRLNGKGYFGAGDLTFNVMKNYRKYGAIPQSVYQGRIDTTERYDYSQLDKSLLGKVKKYVESGRGIMTSTGYRDDITKTQYQTMGEIPASFEYQNKTFTPLSFAREMVGINPDDYMEVTSFTHHPFYQKFILEIESNWDNNYYMNLPLDDFISMIDYSLMHGFSVCWDGDAYRTGFDNGFARLNDTIRAVTQEMRQKDFDDYDLVDVHNMHIVGIAESGTGERFYIIKNSADVMNCGGYLYMSRNYLLMKTISVMVNKNAIPEKIMKKIAAGADH